MAEDSGGWIDRVPGREWKEKSIIWREIWISLGTVQRTFRLQVSDWIGPRVWALLQDLVGGG